MSVSVPRVLGALSQSWVRVLALILGVSGFSPAIASAQSHWGASVSLTPEWTSHDRIRETILGFEGEGSIEGKEFTVGVVRGSTRGGDLDMREHLSRRAVWLLSAAVLAAGVVGQAQSQPGGAVETVATFDSPEATENITQTADGTIVVTGMDDHVLWKVTPGRSPERIPMPAGVTMAVGVAPSDDGGVVVTASERSFRRPGQTPPIDFSDVGPLVLMLDRTGKVTSTTKGGKGQFFNGIASAGGGKFLMADNFSGTVWQFDAATKQITAWLKDPAVPGPNGIKVLNGWVYVSTRNGLMRVQIENGRPKGMPMVMAKEARADDFAVAQDGSVYFPSGTSIMKVSASGEISTIRENIQGGPAAWVSRDGRWLYWPTRGGTGPQKVLRIPLP